MTNRKSHMPLRLVPRSMTLDDLGELLTVKLSKYLKKRMVKVLVWSVALYASETCTLRNDDIKRLEAFEMWIWRKTEKISWTEHITNDQVLTMVGEQRSLMDTIRERQRNWIVHILRGNLLLRRTVLEGKIEGRRTRGSPG